MSCEIIQFSTAARISPKRRKPIAKPERAASDEGEVTDTLKNSRLRRALRRAWWSADLVTDYWRARMDWETALQIAHKYQIGDSDSFPPVARADERVLLDMLRDAVVKQLLTPAPDLRAIAWKRAKLVGRHFHPSRGQPETHRTRNRQRRCVPHRASGAP